MTHSSLENLTDHEKVISEYAQTCIKDNLRANVIYDDVSRIVEIHAIGISNAGNACMRVYEIDSEQWRMMMLSKTVIVVTGTPSEAPRPGYKPDDKGMAVIFKQIGGE